MNSPLVPASLPLRVLRFVVIVGLTLALMLIVGLGYTVFALFSKISGALLLALGVVAILAPLALVIWAARRQWLKWPVLASGLLFTGAVLAWLAWDDPIVRRPLTAEDISPAFEGAERSYAVLLEYGKQHPSEASKAFTARKSIHFKVGGPSEGEKWIEYITENRTTLEAEWAAAAPERAWLERLNTFDRLGDLTPSDFAADIPRFDVWRFLAQRTSAIACLQALDGKGDEAVATLLPMLEVSRKFETSSRTLVRLMIARVAQKICYQTGGFILDHANPGPASRARLLEALQGGNPAAGARRLVLMEYAVFMPALAHLSLTDAMNSIDWTHPGRLPRIFNLAAQFVFNPRATTNLYSDHIHALADLAEARNLEGVAARQDVFVHASSGIHGMKNLGGRLLLNMSIPSYEKVLKSYWEGEDQRLALRARLGPAP